MTIRDDLRHAITDLRRVLALIEREDDHGRTLEQRIREAMNGQPKAANYDSDRVTASGTSDPTGTAALRPDRAAGHMRVLASFASQARAAGDGSVRLATQYEARPATDKERREVDGANDPGCTSCARTDVHSGVTRWEPVHKDKLCRFCYQYRRDTGGLPTEVQLITHHSGQTVKRPA